MKETDTGGINTQKKQEKQQETKPLTQTNIQEHIVVEQRSQPTAEKQEADARRKGKLISEGTSSWADGGQEQKPAGEVISQQQPVEQLIAK